MLKNSVTYFTKNLFQFVYSLINLLQSYNCEQEKTSTIENFRYKSYLSCVSIPE